MIIIIIFLQFACPSCLRQRSRKTNYVLQPSIKHCQSEVQPCSQPTLFSRRNRTLKSTGTYLWQPGVSSIRSFDWRISCGTCNDILGQITHVFSYRPVALFHPRPILTGVSPVTCSCQKYCEFFILACYPLNLLIY